MIRMKQITLTLAEGPIALTNKPRVVNSWYDATQILLSFRCSLASALKQDRREWLGVYKVDYEVLFENGSKFPGIYCLDETTYPDFREFSLRQVKMHAGLDRPNHLTEEQYESFRKQLDPKGEYKQAALAILRDYDFGQNTPRNALTRPVQELIDYLQNLPAGSTCEFETKSNFGGETSGLFGASYLMMVRIVEGFKNK